VKLMWKVTGYSMKIAVASGKGGTGKTTLSVAITQAVRENITLIDCDVEEPNCHLFFPSEKSENSVVTLPVPTVDSEKCSGCGKCAELCQFNAIVSFAGAEAMVFPELCHACGGCVQICPTGAIIEKPFEIGSIERVAISVNAELITGKLAIGHAMAPPVIRAVNRESVNYDTVIIDAPPGTSCPFVTTVSEADYTIFVTEPTPFGLHDLKLAVETIREVGTPFGVVVNRMDQPDNRITDFCCAEEIPVLLQIPISRSVAEAYSNGGTLIDALPEYRGKLVKMIDSLRETGEEKL
jgi:MinD superfamily P-loop ATPase